jgi:hypothetical protein
MITIDVVAQEEMTAAGMLTSMLSSQSRGPAPTNAQIRTGYDHAVRSYGASKGAWIGAISFMPNADGIMQAQRTWRLTDAQQAALGLSNSTAVATFAQRLADAVRESLQAEARRPAGSPLAWSVSAIPHIGGISTPVTAQPMPSATPDPYRIDTPDGGTHSWDENPQPDAPAGTPGAPSVGLSTTQMAIGGVVILGLLVGAVVILSGDSNPAVTAVKRKTRRAR